jgi:hypothetical protein
MERHALVLHGVGRCPSGAGAPALVHLRLRPQMRSVPLMMWIGGLLSSVAEPLYDRLGHVWRPHDLPGPAFTAYGIKVPLLIQRWIDCLERAYPHRLTAEAAAAMSVVLSLLNSVGQWSAGFGVADDMARPACSHLPFSPPNSAPTATSLPWVQVRWRGEPHIARASSTSSATTKRYRLSLAVVLSESRSSRQPASTATWASTSEALTTSKSIRIGEP